MQGLALPRRPVASLADAAMSLCPIGDLPATSLSVFTDTHTTVLSHHYCYTFLTRQLNACQQSQFLVACFLVFTFFNHFAFASSLYPSPYFRSSKGTASSARSSSTNTHKVGWLLTTVATSISHFHCPYCTLTNTLTRFHSSFSIAVSCCVSVSFLNISLI